MSVDVAVIPSIANSINKLSDGAGSEIKLRGGLIDNHRDKFEKRLVRVFVAEHEVSPENLLEHLALVRTHAQEGLARQHACHLDSGTFLRDPESLGRRLGHKAEYLGHENVSGSGELGPVGTHDVFVALPCEFHYGSEMFSHLTQCCLIGSLQRYKSVTKLKSADDNEAIIFAARVNREQQQTCHTGYTSVADKLI